jgi:hypothetical protein
MKAATIKIVVLIKIFLKEACEIKKSSYDNDRGGDKNILKRQYDKNRW